MKWASILSLLLSVAPAFADTIVLAPGETFRLSPIDEIVCERPHPTGLIYDYCRCVKVDEGWQVYRYRKIVDGSETLMQDPLSSGYRDLVTCNQAMSDYAVCLPETPHSRR